MAILVTFIVWEIFNGERSMLPPRLLRERAVLGGVVLVDVEVAQPHHDVVEHVAAHLVRARLGEAPDRRVELVYQPPWQEGHPFVSDAEENG